MQQYIEELFPKMKLMNDVKPRGTAISRNQEIAHKRDEQVGQQLGQVSEVFEKLTLTK